MNRLLIVSIIFLSLSSSEWAQGSAGSKPKTLAQKAILTPTDDDAVPSVKDVVININFDNAQSATVEINSSNESGKLNGSLLSQVLQGLSKPLAEKSSTSKSVQLEPVFVFKPGLSLRLADIMAAINAVRSSTVNNIIVDLGLGSKLFIRRKTKVSEPVKPNPLFLLTRVNSDNEITLNGGPEGNMTDLNKLRDQLSDIFRARVDNGVFRVGSNTVDTTVNLLVPTSTEFAEIKKLVSAVSSAGADRVFLVFERPNNDRKQLITNIEMTPITK
ncbi:MAG: hypothetical protein ABJA02_04760 [Acidobacteriota bacterium]